MRTILWFIYFFGYLACVYPASRKVKKRLAKEGYTSELNAYIEGYVQRWASRLLKAAGASIELKGAEKLINDRAALYVSNHQGNFDIPIMLSKVGGLKPIVAKKELQAIPGIRTWMGYFHCIFMDRDDPRQSLKCLNEAQQLLEGGRSVVIYPEGTRSKGDEMGEFKAGALRCALKAGVPIVPVAINGSYKLMEQQGFWIRPAKVTVTVLPAIETQDLSKEKTKAISEDVKAVIEAALRAQNSK